MNANVREIKYTMAWRVLNRQKAQMEIFLCLTLGYDGVPSMSKREDLPITCAFIHEAMRVKTLAPLAASHATTHTTQLMGYVIPKGTTVSIT